LLWEWWIELCCAVRLLQLTFVCLLVFNKHLLKFYSDLPAVLWVVPLLCKKLLVILRSHLWLELGSCKIDPFLRKNFIKNQINFLHSKKRTNEQTNKQTQTPVKNVTKPISVRCKNLNGSVAEFHYLLSTADHRTFFWKWADNQNKLFQKHILKQLQTLSGLA